MPPTGSRTPSLPIIVSSIIALLVILSVIFHSNINSAFRRFESNRHHRLHHVTTIFRDKPVFENLSPSGDAEWERALLTPKGGFLWVQYNGTTERPYGISMFHALHCLKMLREVIQKSPGMVEKEHKGQGGMHGHETGHGQDMDHIGHCIGYIAQHLLCAADSTIEPSKITLDKEGFATQFQVDGKGFQHQCRDHSELKKVVERSEKQAVKEWNWRMGDTVESVWTSNGIRRPR
ncbi:MAG: hypothetical protein Q9183_007723 [Haloplaca sp. 2 TL-2023]